MSTSPTSTKLRYATRVELASGAYIIVPLRAHNVQAALNAEHPDENGFVRLSIEPKGQWPQTALIDPEAIVALWELAPYPTNGPDGNSPIGTRRH